MNRISRLAMTTALSAVALLAAPLAQALPSAGFTDVDDTSTFCPNVEWLKNRAVTTGCTSATLYCPTDPVSRLAMAAFMNRLGTALTPAQLRVDGAPGPVDLDANVVVCQTTDLAITGYPRTAYVDLCLSATATADVGLASDLVIAPTVAGRGRISTAMRTWGRCRRTSGAGCRTSATVSSAWGSRCGSGADDAGWPGRHDGPDRQPLPAAGAGVQPQRDGVAVLAGTERPRVWRRRAPRRAIRRRRRGAAAALSRRLEDVSAPPACRPVTSA